MKNLKLFSAIVLFPMLTFAQRVRVFEHFALSTAFGNKGTVPSMAYTQSLAVGKSFGFRISSGIRYSYFITKKQVLESNGNESLNDIELNKNLTTSAFNIPIGFEVGNRTLAVGINVDLIGFSLSKSRGLSSFKVVDTKAVINEPSIKENNFNFLPSGSGALNSQLYASITPNPNLSFKIGMAYNQVNYKGSLMKGTVSENWTTFSKNDFRPFLGLQVNFEN